MAVTFIGYRADKNFYKFWTSLLERKISPGKFYVVVDRKLSDMRQAIFCHNRLERDKRSEDVTVGLINNLLDFLSAAKLVGATRFEGRSLVSDAVLVATATRSQIKKLCTYVPAHELRRGYVIIENGTVPGLPEVQNAILLIGKKASLEAMNQIVKDAIKEFVFPHLYLKDTSEIPAITDEQFLAIGGDSSGLPSYG